MPDSDVHDEYRRLCVAMGALFHRFGQLETILTTMLKLHLSFYIAGAMKGNNPQSEARIHSTKVAGAIYGGMRFSQSRDTIKRILAAEGADKTLHKFATEYFSHIGHIQSLRDKIAHQHVTPAHDDLEGYWQVTDALTTKDITKPKVWTFDTNAVGLASLDLEIALGIANLVPQNSNLLSGITDFSPPPWRYKSSMLKPVPHSKLNTHPEHQPPPQSSQA